MKRETRMAKIIWKLFPKTTGAVWQAGFQKGVKHGAGNERLAVSRRLQMHHVKDFGKPALTLGYEQAVKAAKDEIDA